MAKHEFGIMQCKPKSEERFDEYEPDKYDCIVVDDDFIEPILMELESIEFYLNSIDIKGNGLAYCGITLIPPESMDSMINILLMHDRLEYSELIYLLNKAEKEGKYIIHFGI